MHSEAHIEEELQRIHQKAIEACKHGHPPRALKERKNMSKFVPEPLWFEYHLDKSGECWMWTRSKYKNGYGHLQVGGKRVMTHRYAYMLWRGKIPEGMLVCHKCDNPPCCNPEHLFLGTHKDNLRDAMAKGRWWAHGAHGERNQGAKITAEQALLIRDSSAPTKLLSEQFGISYGQIQKIRNRESWRCL